MKKVNYRSDFDFLFAVSGIGGTDTGFPEFDWTLELWAGTARARSVTVSCIGGECTNCFNDGGRIHVVLKDHGLAPGPLRGVFTARLSDAIYPDGIRKEVTPDRLGIELTTCKGDTGDLDAAIVLPVVIRKEKEKRKTHTGPKILSRRAMTMNSHPEYAYRVTNYDNHGYAVRFDFPSKNDEDYIVDSDTLTHLVSWLKENLRKPGLAGNHIELNFERGRSVTGINQDFPDYDPATNTLTVRSRDNYDPSVRMHVFCNALEEGDFAYLREDGRIGITQDVIIPLRKRWPTYIDRLSWDSEDYYTIYTDKGAYRHPVGVSRRRDTVFGMPRIWRFDVQWYHVSYMAYSRDDRNGKGEHRRVRWCPRPKRNGGIMRVRIAAHDGLPAGPWQYFRHPNSDYKSCVFVKLG